MKVLLWPGDTGGCAFYRMRLPAGIARANGMDIELLDKVPARLQDDGHYKIVTAGFEGDVVVIQRPVYQHIVEAIPLLQEEGIKVVVEIDDDLEGIARDHMAYKRLHPEYSPVMNWKWFRKATEMCDFLTCSTPALAKKYGRGGRVAVIPNYIAKEVTEIEPKDPLHAVGWTSSVGTHPNDLQQTKGGVGAAIDATGAKVYVVGDQKDVTRLLGCTPGTSVASPGWVPQEEYYFYIRAAKVGIVPLEPTAFNQAKSNLKGLEFAAVGVPFVASPTSEYVELANKGAGVLAYTGQEWYEATKAYLTDPIFRADMADQGRETIKKHFLLEDHWHLYPEAWEQAMLLPRKNNTLSQ